jgi:protein-S-isoprenylcysteine O-methyltransferase Ste14
MLISQEKYTTEGVCFEWAIKFRQPISIAVVIACLALLLATPLSWQVNGSLGKLSDALGFALIVFAAFGRIWSSLYISGYKEHRIVTEGPYAIVRNPLYVSSFIGALGMGLVTGNLRVLVLIAGAFLFYYPLVVLAEENNLQHKFGQAYREYASRVPRFLPRRLPLVEPDTYPVRPRHVRRSLQEIIWFFWFYLILHLVTGLQHGGDWFTALHIF